MHKLTLEQKIENVEELILARELKIKKLSTEVENLKRKKQKFQKLLDHQTSGKSIIEDAVANLKASAHR